MKKVVLVVVLTLVLGTGAVYAGNGNSGNAKAPAKKQVQVVESYDCGIEGCTKTKVHYHKNYDPENCINPDGPGTGTGAKDGTGNKVCPKVPATNQVLAVEEFDCGIEGCTKVGEHYHKNYDPENCINPDGPGSGSGDRACDGTGPKGNGNGRGK